MAAFALRPKDSLVLVVFFMTADAGSGRNDFFSCRLPVAVIAADSLMRAGELECRACIMIKVPDLPIPRVMALRTLAAEPAFVDVVLPMASVAGCRRRVLVEMAGMATFTCCGAMPTEEGIFRIPVMIEQV